MASGWSIWGRSWSWSGCDESWTWKLVKEVQRDGVWCFQGAMHCRVRMLFSFSSTEWLTVPARAFVTQESEADFLSLWTEKSSGVPFSSTNKGRTWGRSDDLVYGPAILTFKLSLFHVLIAGGSWVREWIHTSSLNVRSGYFQCAVRPCRYQIQHEL